MRIFDEALEPSKAGGAARARAPGEDAVRGGGRARGARLPELRPRTAAVSSASSRDMPAWTGTEGYAKAK